jgi:predicted N-acyltransferase
MQQETASNDYVIRVHDHPAGIDAAAWNGLLAVQPAPTPFLRHEYLLALHESGSATAATGWQPQYLSAHAGGVLAAVCPLYLKTHSYGEYVFDWAWADAYHRNGLDYYPKLLSAVPFTPVPGTRLLAQDMNARLALLQTMEQLVQQTGLSSAHLLFLDEADRQAVQAKGWMLRSTVQFHWTNRAPEPYADLNDFLHSLHRDKRKKILQERRRVNDAGVHFTTSQGADISQTEWDFFYRCYRQTYQAHHSTPYLTREFFARMAAVMPECWVLFTAWKDGQRIAASLIAIDPIHRLAFGRYWGAVESLPCLHFEACYYQPLEWCIAQGFQRFEGGAQGEHKMARGLMPVQTWSAHWLAHPQFAHAVAEFLQREGAGMADYMDELHERRPFKASPASKKP